MSSVFLYCMGIGGLVLVVQVVLSLVGIVDDGLTMEADGGTDALNLLSVRSLSAGATLYGATGILFDSFLPAVLAAIIAVAPAVAAAWATAWLTRLMRRAETSGNIRLDAAGGQMGTVYLPVPPERSGTGLVQFTLQGRTLELKAFTRETAELPTGAPVLVISVDPETETAEVISSHRIEGLES